MREGQNIMAKYASKVLKQAQAWIGRNEYAGTHSEIIDVYNAHKPLARGYKVKYTDAWCSTFVSAVAIKCGYTDIIPTECGCQQQIELFKKLGCWIENENRTPKPGDIIFYDWDDNGVGDNKGYSDHVGIVENVSGGKITVIEGNCDNAVKRNYIAVNGKGIRGYGVPKYDAEPGAASGAATSKPADTAAATSGTAKKATDAAQSFLASLAGTYKVTASALNVRSGAGTNKAILTTIPKGTAVNCYGYYTTVAGVKWLYVQFTHNNVTHTGFCSSQYLRKA